jgi:hypothetical protein
LAQIIHIGLTTVLILTIGLQVWLIYSAWFATPVIKQVEAEIGQALSCDEAYNRREIDGFFYPAHRAQVDTGKWLSVGGAVLAQCFGPGGDDQRAAASQWAADSPAE